MLDRVKAFAYEHDLIRPNSTVVAACSGGPDSMAMVDMLFALSHEMQFNIVVAHFEHGIRGQESLDDADFVKAYAMVKGLSFRMENGDVPAYSQASGKSLEVAARELRYGFLAKVAAEFDNAVIATAHHRDDQAETVLMNILRGAGLTGLSGIRPKRGNVIRPVLFLSKEQLTDYCFVNHIAARLDKTNEVPDSTRNKIRLNLMPNLASSYNQAITEGLCHLADIAATDGDYITGQVKKIYDDLTWVEDGRVKVMRQDIVKQHPAVRRRLLQMLINFTNQSDKLPQGMSITGGMSNVGYVHIKILNELLQNGTTGTRVSLPGDIQATMDYDVLSVYKRSEEAMRISEFSPTVLNIPGRTEFSEGKKAITAEILRLDDLDEAARIKLENEIAAKDTNKIVLDYQSIISPVIVRQRLEGDRLLLTGGTKKLKDYFIDKKLPREERVKVPLVLDERGILWVVGQVETILARVTDHTKEFLILTYEELKHDKFQ